VQFDIFAVMNCCVVALTLFSSDIVTWSADSLDSVQWHKIRGVRVKEYVYYVKKLRQNIGSETWIRRQIVTSQTAYTKCKWPPHATEWNSRHEDFLRTPLIAILPTKRLQLLSHICRKEEHIFLELLIYNLWRIMPAKKTANNKHPYALQANHVYSVALLQVKLRFNNWQKHCKHTLLLTLRT